MLLFSCLNLSHCCIVQGLVVPVLRDVGNMNYSEIEKALNELGEKVNINMHFGIQKG